MADMDRSNEADIEHQAVAVEQKIRLVGQDLGTVEQPLNTVEHVEQVFFSFEEEKEEEEKKERIGGAADNKKESTVDFPVQRVQRVLTGSDPCSTAPVRTDACSTAVDSITDATQAVAKLHTVQGVVRVGNLYDEREHYSELSNPDLQALLCAPLNDPRDVQITAGENTQITFLDLDTHHIKERLTDEVLVAHAATLFPRPEAWWISHGGGIKAVYIGLHHRARTVTAALNAPKLFTAEIKSDSRHPLSLDTNRPANTCGMVTFEETNPSAPFAFSVTGELTPELRAAALAELQLDDGQRYDHNRCPIDGGAVTIATACVAVHGDMVYCFRCASHGVSAAPNLKAGVFPLRRALHEAPLHELDHLVKHLVHWTHARLHLKQLFSNKDETLLREAYRLALEAHYNSDGITNDPRIPMVFNRDLNFIYCDGRWVDAGTPERERQVDNDVANFLPYCLYVAEEPEKEKDKSSLAVKVNPPRRSRVKSGCPDAYKPVKLFRGYLFKGDDNSIPVRVGGTSTISIEPQNHLSEAEAFATLEASFPGISRAYLKAILAGAICVEMIGGMPPMIACEGPSGSGKGETVSIAAGFLADAPVKLQLGESKEFFASIGSGLAEGKRFFQLDEIGKNGSLSKRQDLILQLSSQVTWRPLYMPTTQTQNRAVYVLTSVSLPEYLRQADEFNRRVCYIRLNRKVPSWMTCGCGDNGTWRERSELNAKAANSILFHTYKLCSEHGYVFQRVADALGMGKLSGSDEHFSTETCRNLYLFARGEKGKRVMLTKAPMVKGWVDLAGVEAKEFIAPFMTYDDSGEGSRQRHVARLLTTNNLQAIDWNSVLGIGAPDIQCRVKTHGSSWGMRFQSAGALRGQELVNEQLPPLPGTVPPSATPAPLNPPGAPATESLQAPTLAPAVNAAALNILKQGEKYDV